MQARGIDDSSQNVARFERRNVWAGNMKGYQGQRNCLEQRRLDVLKDGRKKKELDRNERERRYSGKRELVWICSRWSQKETETREPMEGAETGLEVEKALGHEDGKKSRKEIGT